jgi:hypothetical protein
MVARRPIEAVEMTVCGKHGKTMKLFSHPSHSPWKSLRRFPHYHRHGYDEHEYLSKPVKAKTRRNDAQYHYPGGPNQMVKVGHAGIANSAEPTGIHTISTVSCVSGDRKGGASS